MPSFWKTIELTNDILRVTCAHPAMSALATKIGKDRIKFSMTTEMPWFSITSDQSYRLAKMVHEVVREKSYDPRFELTNAMTNTIGDAMIFGFDNRNLALIEKPREAVIFANKSKSQQPAAIGLAKKTPSFSTTGFTEIYAAKISGNRLKIRQLAEAGRYVSSLRRANSRQTAIHICLEQFANASLKPGLAEAHVLQNDKFVLFMHTLEELLLAGCNPDYKDETESVLAHPTLYIEPTFSDVCTYAILHHEYYPELLMQIANIFALLINHGAPIPKKDDAPFKHLDPNGFDLLKHQILLAYNVQNPEKPVLSLEELSKLPPKSRNRPG